MPKLTIFSDKYVTGIGHDKGPSDVPFTLAYAMPDALLGHASSDSHFALGLVHQLDTGEVAQHHYRVNIAGFEMLATHGLEWRLAWLAADIDRNGHASLSPTLSVEEKRAALAGERELVLSACGSAGFGRPFAIWPTRRGWRAVWRVAQTRIASAAEYEHVKGRIAEFIARLRRSGLDGRSGLAADVSCMDPTRFFRMPKVVRDGVQTWTEDYMVLSNGVELFNNDKELNLLDIDPAASGQPGPGTQVEGTRAQPDRPDPEARRSQPTTVTEFRLKFDSLGSDLQHRVRRWIEEGHRKGSERLASTERGGRQKALFGLVLDTQRAINVGLLSEDAMEDVFEAAIKSGLPEAEITSTLKRKRRAVVDHAPDLAFILHRLEGSGSDSRLLEALFRRPASNGPKESRFPRESLPPELLRYADAVAHAYQVPLELAVMPVLALTAACMLRTVRIRLSPSWSENVNLWIAVLADTGERKSAVYREVHAPFEAWRAEAIETWKTYARAKRDEIDIIDQQIASLKKSFVKESVGMEDYEPTRKEAASSLSRLHEQRLRLESEIPPSPDIGVQDATGEAFIERLEQTGGRAYLSDTEGSTFANIAGRYGNGSKPPSVEAFLKAKSSEAYSYDRRSTNRVEKRIYIPQLDAVALQVVQPAAFRQVLEEPYLRQVGFLARWIVVRAPSRVGYRPLIEDPIPPASRNWYEGLIGSLLRRFLPADAEAVELQLSPEAARAFKEEVYDYIEQQMRADGLLRHARDVGCRAPATILQFAACLHMHTHGVSGSSHEISLATLRSAMVLGTWALEQTLDILNPKPDAGSGSVAEFAAAQVEVAANEQLDVSHAYAAYRAWHGSVRDSEQPLLNSAGGAFTKELKRVLRVSQPGGLSKSSGTARQIPGFRLAHPSTPGDPR